MVIYTLEQSCEVVLRSTYRRCRLCHKNRIIFSDEALAQKIRTLTFKSERTQTSHCLVRILVQRPFFFENDEGEAVAVNGDRYRAMLNEVLFTKFEEEDIGNI